MTTNLAKVPTTASATAGYSLGTTEAEYQRLRAQAQVWEQATERVLDRIDLRPGSQCLDAGCGPGVTMRQLARRVGSSGRVVGIDIDEALGHAQRGRTPCRRASRVRVPHSQPD